MAKAPPTIAATSTLAMVRTATARGIEVGDLLASAGLSLETLEDPDARLPGATVLGLWNALRERAKDPALQLAAPASLPFGAYRLIDYIVAASDTVGAGIDRFVRFFGLIADAIAMRIDEMPDEYVLSLTTAAGGPVPPVYVDYVFAALVTRVRMRIRPDLRVRRLDLRQPKPAAAAQYRKLFGAPVQFSADADRLVFSRAVWQLQSATADASLRRLLEDHASVIEQRLSRASSGFRADVQRRIAAVPAEGGSAVAVARALNVSVRTLQRKLEGEGATFAALSNEVRGQLAEQYLDDPKVSIAEVAFLLGFSDETSFNRAFRRWTGEPPGRWRRGRHGPTRKRHGP